MPNINALKPNASHVTALYQDGWEHFDLPEGATLVELASHLRGVALMHKGSPLSIKVQLDTGQRPSQLPPGHRDLDQAYSLVNRFAAHFTGRPLHTHRDDL
jgi:hypothetical protein